MGADHLLPQVLESSYWQVEIRTISSDRFFFPSKINDSVSNDLQSWKHKPQGVDKFVILLHLQPESASSVQVVCAFSGAANTVSHY